MLDIFHKNIDVPYDDKMWGNVVDPNEWNTNFLVLESFVNDLVNQSGIEIQRIDEKLVSHDVSINNRPTKQEAGVLIKGVEFEPSTGVFKITRFDGTVQTIDTNAEKIPVEYSYDETNKTLIITLTDGNKTTIPVADLFQDYRFTDSDTILSTNQNLPNYIRQISFNIKPNSLNTEHFNSEVFEKFALYEANSKLYSENSKQSELSALNYYKNCLAESELAKQHELTTKGYMDSTFELKELTKSHYDKCIQALVNCPKIGENGNWLVYDFDNNCYYDTKIIASVKGDTGSSGVYIGESEPTDPNVTVWVKPSGSQSDLATKQYVDNICVSIEKVLLTV